MQLKPSVRTPQDEAELVTARHAGLVRWRKESDRVEQAYRTWLAAPQAKRASAHSVYMAALDREETAARAYELSVEAARVS